MHHENLAAVLKAIVALADEWETTATGMVRLTSQELAREGASERQKLLSCYARALRNAAGQLRALGV